MGAHTIRTSGDLLLHETALIATIAGAFVFAFVLGMLASYARLPPLVGYLLAGVMMGPFTPGFVGDLSLASQLAEIGVILLMFGVGLHFSIPDLLAVRRIAVPGAIVQILVATLLGAAMAHVWGWDLPAGLMFGLSLSVASTVVLLRALEQQGKLNTPVGRIAVGWLIVEDLVMVLALVLIPALAEAFAGSGAGDASAISLLKILGVTLAKVAMFVALALVVGVRVVPWLLTRVARTGSRELFTLGVLAIALGIAFGSAALFGVSFALGAFFAGVVMSESDLSHRAAERSLPLQDAFAVLFFVSVGMLFDPGIILREPLQLLGVMAVIVVGKSIAAFAIVMLFRFPLGTALTVSASLAQIGEFSFILAALGVALNLLPPDGRDLILAGALLSITLNPLFFAIQPRLERWLKSTTFFAASDTGAVAAASAGHAIVVGHGRVGSAITSVLEEARQPFVVIDSHRPRFEALQARGVPAFYGDAREAVVLNAAGIQNARVLLVATAEAFQSRRVVEVAHALNPQLSIIARALSDTEQAALSEAGAGLALTGERELARAMLRRALHDSGYPAEDVDRLSARL
jgi:monovalent cation:H+ antiporter-2, CPA2 family